MSNSIPVYVSATPVSQYAASPSAQPLPAGGQAPTAGRWRDSEFDCFNNCTPSFFMASFCQCVIVSKTELMNNNVSDLLAAWPNLRENSLLILLRAGLRLCFCSYRISAHRIAFYWCFKFDVSLGLACDIPTHYDNTHSIPRTLQHSRRSVHGLLLRLLLPFVHSITGTIRS
jgi:hypothetical protein